MPIQYITDTAGEHTAVLIPIHEWELITRKHADLKSLETAAAKQMCIRDSYKSLRHVLFFNGSAIKTQ